MSKQIASLHNKRTTLEDSGQVFEGIVRVVYTGCINLKREFYFREDSGRTRLLTERGKDRVRYIDGKLVILANGGQDA